jgi:hypothetical protein
LARPFRSSGASPLGTAGRGGVPPVFCDLSVPAGQARWGRGEGAGCRRFGATFPFQRGKPAGDGGEGRGAAGLARPFRSSGASPLGTRGGGGVPVLQAFLLEEVPKNRPSPKFSEIFLDKMREFRIVLRVRLPGGRPIGQQFPNLQIP